MVLSSNTMNIGDSLMPYDDSPKQCGSVESYEQSLVLRLQKDKARAEERLANINNALEAIQKNPQVLEVLDAIRKV